MLLTQVAVTWLLVGLIWMIQCVQYPCLRIVPTAIFAPYHQKHVRNMTAVVVPPMLLEGGTALGVLIQAPHLFLAWFNGGLLGLIWLVTVAIHTPIHTPIHLRLRERRSEDLIQKLIWFNWIRTVAWTLRGGRVLVLLWVLYIIKY
ncbi:MAG TPA: hypothetical protein VMF06_17710 [Candidatus Limnocylindria bacterium]|nr:hypothetical protein [Candidatus Limnocylindria bacterium]